MTEIKSAALELGTERIRKLLVQYAVPAIIAMTASSLYNMVDSIFIGHGVGPLAISGLALTFPLMNLAAAFGSLVGVGAATLISMRLGQRDYETAQRVLGNVLVLNLIIGIAFGLAALLFLDPILYFFGASEATIGYAREYMTVILLGNVVTHMYLGLNSVLRASGHPRKSMYATINTVVINTILDPLFIFGFGWGIRGAAIATVLAQVISLVWQLRILSNKQELLHFRRGIYCLQKKIVRDMLAIGMSPFLMNLAACFIVILINKGLKEYGGDLMIGAYGIVNRLAFFFVMIVLGVNQGMQPIAGYNFGAKQYDRMMRVLKLTMIGATCVTTAGFLLGEFMPRLAVGMFTSDEELIRQYIQHQKIAEDFAAYLDLYYKYRDDYGVEDILAGKAKPAAFARLLQAPFDERLSLVSLLLSGLETRFAASRRADAVADGCYAFLKETKKAFAGMPAELAQEPNCWAQLFGQMTADYEAETQKKRTAGLLDKPTLEAHLQTAKTLRGWEKTLLRAAAPDADAAFKVLREQFGTLSEARDTAQQGASAALEAAFDFMEQAFAESQEMVVFVTELTLSPAAHAFIAENGCERYFQYNKDLLLDHRKAALNQELEAEQRRHGML